MLRLLLYSRILLTKDKTFSDDRPGPPTGPYNQGQMQKEKVHNASNKR